MALISKDEPLKTSMVNIGYLILKKLDKVEGGRLSLPELTTYLKSWGIHRYRPIMFSLIFLHSVGAIDFQAPYIYKLK
jgi:hypothetical protein